jgi:hypothetical protein
VQQPQAGLEIKASLSIFFFTLYLFPPKISIDGSEPIAATWGDNLIPMTPGRHSVSMWYPLYWFLPVNRGELVVDIQPGQVAQLVYKPRWLIFLPGKLDQVGVRGMVSPGAAAQLPQAAAGGAGQAPGWHPDPSGKHEMRYWNGTGWTEDVSDKGVAAKDPA